MTQRIDYRSAAPDGFAAMRGLEKYVRHCGLPRKLVELVKMRASQINGCAHCLDMHSKDARAAGESEPRLYVLPGWREAPFYDERARRHFSEKELVDLTLAVIAINGWNRLAIPFRATVGDYQPGRT